MPAPSISNEHSGGPSSIHAQSMSSSKDATNLEEHSPKRSPKLTPASPKSGSPKATSPKHGGRTNDPRGRERPVNPEGCEHCLDPVDDHVLQGHDAVPETPEEVQLRAQIAKDAAELEQLDRMIEECVDLKESQIADKQSTFLKAPLFMQNTLRFKDQEEEMEGQLKRVLETRNTYPNPVDRLPTAKRWRARGNALVEEGRYADALQEYERAISVFFYFVDDGDYKPIRRDIIDTHFIIEDQSSALRNENSKASGYGGNGISEVISNADLCGKISLDILEIVGVCMLNLALCFLKSEEWENGKYAAGQSIEWLSQLVESVRADPEEDLDVEATVKNMETKIAKAYFRRALCSCKLGTLMDYEFGIKDLRQAKRMHPEATEIARELEKRKLQYSEMTKRSREKLQNMFKAGDQLYDTDKMLKAAQQSAKVEEHLLSERNDKQV